MTDERSDITETVPADLVGVFKGSMCDGEEVEVLGVRGKDRVLKPEVTRNLTTKGQVRKYSTWEWIKAWRGCFSNKTKN